MKQIVSRLYCIKQIHRETDCKSSSNKYTEKQIVSRLYCIFGRGTSLPTLMSVGWLVGGSVCLVMAGSYTSVLLSEHLQQCLFIKRSSPLKILSIIFFVLYLREATSTVYFDLAFVISRSSY